MPGRRASGQRPVTFAQTPDVPDKTSQRAFDVLNAAVHDLQTRAGVIRGKGSPEGIVAANPGALYVNTDGGANATLWVKESGFGAEGWVAK